jgi:CO/xanthine dehydrogenase Mo-binding subunit
MASSGGKVVIEPLDVDNYDTWCVRMKLFFIHKKMWNVVVDSTATAKQLQGALALIGLHVKDHHLVAADKTAKKLWDDLETTYKSKSNARKMLLRREINTLKLVSGEPISMYVAEDLYKKLTAAGADMKLEKLAFAFLAGLPDKYGPLMTILEATAEKMSAKEMLPL